MTVIFQIPDEILVYILEFLPTNADMISVTSTCRIFKNIGREFGYCKTILFGGNSNYLNMSNYYHPRNWFLTTLTIEKLDNPMAWIPMKWPKEMLFNCCALGSKLIDPPVSNTELLVIQDLNRNSNKDVIKINWCKLPKLRILDIYSNDIDFTGLDLCKDLEIIRIDVKNYARNLPDFVQDFQFLKTLAVSCSSKSSLHFVSTKLRRCFVPKTKEFTATSQFVPIRHLHINSEQPNLQCLDIY
jgi:hypothetical protein